jgi:diaminopimelate epimerase
MLRFRKMPGLGDDFLALDKRAAPRGLIPEAARFLADRHRGIGAVAPRRRSS